MSRRALLVAYNYPPIGGGGVQRLVKFARYLPEFGYEPIVVTGPGVSSDWWAPPDPSLAAEIAEVEVHRLRPDFPVAGRAWLDGARRLAGAATAYERWWQDGVRALTEALAPSVDVILGELVPYYTGKPLAAAALTARRPWVADLQDPWALDEMWLYPSALHRLRDRRTMRHVLNAADAVVMNTPEAVLRVARAFPELRPKLTDAIPNGLDHSDFPDEPPPPPDGVFRIVHAGYLHTEFGLKHRRKRRRRELLGGPPLKGVDFLSRSHVFLLEAIDRLLRQDPGLANALEVHLAGQATETDRAIASRSPVTRVHGYVSHAETIERLRSANLLFLPMHDLPPGVRAGLVPGKTYEYLASGKPILAAVPEGDARDLLREAGNALISSPQDVTHMAELIASEIERWRAGTPTGPPNPEVVARYDRRRQTGQLAAVFDAVLAGRSPAQGAIGRTETLPKVTSA